MPNRYVREDAIESERVNALSWQGEVFYRRLLNRVDDFGRFTANPELLRASIFPLQLSKVHAADIGKLLLECEHAGLVSRWKGPDGKEYLGLHTWEKGRAQSSKYPDPPTDVSERLRTNVYRREQTLTDSPDPDPDPDPDSDKARGRARFRPPSVQEVRAYCLERGNGIDPEAFVDFYASKGWKVGGAPMKDWQAAVRTWEKRHKAEAGKNPQAYVPEFV